MLYSYRPVTIVMYHSIGGAHDGYTVSTPAFRRQLEQIRARWPIVRLGDVPAILTGSTRRRRVVVLTFDDAFRDFREHAFPVLADLGLPATVFVPTGWIGRSNAWDRGRSAYVEKPIMGAADLSELQATGLVSFGSHTVDHVRLGRLSLPEVRRQVGDSRGRLEDLLGRAVTQFAYPYGQLGDFSEMTERALEDAGYEVAVTTHWGTLHRRQEVRRLRRIYFDDRDVAGSIYRKVAGWQDWRGGKERLGHALRRAGLRRSP